MENNSYEMSELIKSALDDKKAVNVKIIDISGVSVIADAFIIAEGTNTNQVQALCDNVLDKMGRAGYTDSRVEGYETANWILIDFGDVVVHIFDSESRTSYNLERLWRDGKTVDIV